MGSSSMPLAGFVNWASIFSMHCFRVAIHSDLSFQCCNIRQSAKRGTRPPERAEWRVAEGEVALHLRRRLSLSKTVPPRERAPRSFLLDQEGWLVAIKQTQSPSCTLSPSPKSPARNQVDPSTSSRSLAVHARQLAPRLPEGRTGSSNLTTISSTAVASPRTSGSACRAKSWPSDQNMGPIGHNQRDLA
jgi:hypothetical protein